MPILQTFLYKKTDELYYNIETILPIQRAWELTLTDEEHSEWNDAVKRQQTLRQVVIDSGNLQLTEKSEYIYKDKEARKKEKPMDKVWLKYFKRFLSENGLTLTVVDTEI